MKMRRRRRGRPTARKTIVILVILVLALAALVGWVALRPSKRVFEAESAEMVAKRRSSENALFALLKAAAALPERPSQRRGRDEGYKPAPGSLGELIHVYRPDDDPKLSSYLANTGPAMTAAREALQKPYFLNPPEGDEMESGQRYGEFWTLGRVMAARARWLVARDGDGREAMALVVDGIRLGRMISRDGVCQDVSFYSGEIQHRAAEAAQHVARHCSDEVLRDALRELSAEAAHVEPGRNALLCSLRDFDEKPQLWTQYYANPADDWIVDVMNAKLSLGEKWQIRKVRRCMRKHLDELLEVSDMPFLEYQAWEVWNGRKLPSGFGIGNYLWHIAQSRATARTCVAGAAVSCALELHRRTHGAYPKSLDELVLPEGLGLPLDPYSGKPLVYHRTEDDYILYSVGWDQTDNGGNAETGRDVVIYEPDEIPKRR